MSSVKAIGEVSKSEERTKCKAGLVFGVGAGSDGRGGGRDGGGAGAGLREG